MSGSGWKDSMNPLSSRKQHYQIGLGAAKLFDSGNSGLDLGADGADDLR